MIRFIRNFNYQYLLLMMFTILTLQVLISNFNVINHQILLLVLIGSAVYLWFMYYILDTKFFIENFVSTWFVITSIIFYNSDIKHGFILSPNFLILFCTILIIASNSIIFILLKENIKLKQAKTRFFNNLQHNWSLDTHGVLFWADEIYRKHKEGIAFEDNDFKLLNLCKTRLEQLYDVTTIMINNAICKNTITLDKKINAKLITDLLINSQKKYNNTIVFNNFDFEISNYNLIGNQQSLIKALQEIFNNLFEYSVSINEVSISFSYKNHYLKITMSNGTFIPDNELKTIFQVGEVASKNVKKEGNRGYGLTMAKYFLEVNKGNIVAHNIGNKTYFTVFLRSECYSQILDKHHIGSLN